MNERHNGLNRFLAYRVVCEMFSDINVTVAGPPYVFQ